MHPFKYLLPGIMLASCVVNAMEQANHNYLAMLPKEINAAIVEFVAGNDSPDYIKMYKAIAPYAQTSKNNQNVVNSYFYTQLPKREEDGMTRMLTWCIEKDCNTLFEKLLSQSDWQKYTNDDIEQIIKTAVDARNIFAINLLNIQGILPLASQDRKERLLLALVIQSHNGLGDNDREAYFTCIEQLLASMYLDLFLVIDHMLNYEMRYNAFKSPCLTFGNVWEDEEAFHKKLPLPEDKRALLMEHIKQLPIIIDTPR